MDFTHFNVDITPNGKVTGAGSDENGPFEMVGEYDAASNLVKFKKHYDNNVSWDYWGNIQGNEIVGSWGY